MPIISGTIFTPFFPPFSPWLYARVVFCSAYEQTQSISMVASSLFNIIDGTIIINIGQQWAWLVGWAEKLKMSKIYYGHEVSVVIHKNKGI